jgi:hypothetical protein
MMNMTCAQAQSVFNAWYAHGARDGEFDMGTTFWQVIGQWYPATYGRCTYNADFSTGDMSFYSSYGTGGNNCG